MLVPWEGPASGRAAIGSRTSKRPPGGRVLPKADHSWGAAPGWYGGAPLALVGWRLMAGASSITPAQPTFCAEQCNQGQKPSTRRSSTTATTPASTGGWRDHGINGELYGIAGHGAVEI